MEKNTTRSKNKSATNAELLSKWDINYGRLSEILTDMMMDSIPSIRTWTPSEAASVRKGINRDVRSWLGSEYGSKEGAIALSAAKSALEGKTIGGAEQVSFFENSDYRNTTLLLYMKDDRIFYSTSKTSMFSVDDRISKLPPWRDSRDGAAVFIGSNGSLSWSPKIHTAEVVVFRQTRDGGMSGSASAGHESFTMYVDEAHTKPVPAVVIYVPDIEDMYFPTELKVGNIFGRYYRPNNWRDSMDESKNNEPATAPAVQTQVETPPTTEQAAEPAVPAKAETASTPEPTTEQETASSQTE